MNDKEYIERHDIERVTKEMLQALLEIKPKDPFAFLIKGFEGIQKLKELSDEGIVDYYSTLISANSTSELLDKFGDDSATPFPKEFQPGRRASVSAESYQPSEVDPTHFVIIPKNSKSVHSIESAVSKNLLFKNLDPLQRRRIIDAMFERKVLAGETVIKQGDEGDNFYVVDQGTFSVQIYGKGEVSKIGPGGTFGELALMYNTPRAASVISLTNGLLWAVDRFTFRKVIIDIASRKRKMYEGFLRNVPLLQSLEQGEICRIADALEPVSFNPHETVIRQGDVGDSFYIIIEGEADVYVDGKVVNHLSAGEYFGELALLNDTPRSASIIAITALNCVALDASSFRRLLGPLDELLKSRGKSYKGLSVY
jgi:CRP-like cAMP-binding protein